MEPTDINSLEYGINCTIFSIREHLMQYYKGIGNYQFEGNIMRQDMEVLPENRRAHNYERQRVDLQQPQKLLIGRTTLAELGRSPSTITLYTEAFKRSEELTAVYDGVSDFLHRYLRGVTIVEADKGWAETKGDKPLVMKNKVRYDMPATQPPYDATYARLMDQFQAGWRSSVVPPNRSSIGWDMEQLQQLTYSPRAASIYSRGTVSPTAYDWFEETTQDDV